MKTKAKKGLKITAYILAGIVLVYLILCINTKWAFIPEGSFILDVLKAIKTCGKVIL